MSMELRCDRTSACSICSSPGQSRCSPLCKNLAARSSVREVNNELVAALSRDRPDDQFGGFWGGIVPELVPIVVTHDPVVEAVVRKNVNSSRCHRLSSTP